MLKFVRQGGAGQPEDEWTAVSVAAVAEPKDEDHDCTVCKTRRRSLERQTAHVLRRSRSRETLRSASNSSSTNDEDIGVSEHSKMSQDVNRMQVGGGGWGAKSDKYRRLSRSCEALSMSNKSVRWKRGDVDEDVKQPNNGLSRIKLKTGTIGGSPLCKDLKICAANSKKDESSILKNKDVNRQILCSQTLITDCKTRQLSVKETGYTHGLCRDGDDRNRKSPERVSTNRQDAGARSTMKQVKFGGIEYEKSKEQSVMGKLRNVVSGNRRKLRSRSLERIDHREEWNPVERSEERMPCTERIGRSRSKSWVQDEESITLSVKLQRSDRDMAGESVSDYEYQQQQQQRRNCKRSRSRSKERKDRVSEESKTGQGEGHLYHYDDKQQFFSQRALSKDENCNRNRRRSSSDNRLISDNKTHVNDRTYDLQYDTPTRSNTNCGSGPQQVGRTCHSKWREETTSTTLISPQYVAPNGHYGNAVVRKCHREQKQTIETKQAPRNNVKVLKLESVSKTGDAASSSGQNVAANTNNRRDNARRSTLPKLEKCGISATKIAKLDSPLKLQTPDLSIIDSIIDAPTISIMHFKDDESISDCSPIHNTDNMQNMSRVESNEGDILKSTTSNHPSSSGYVYNCTTAKITKLNQPETGINNCVQQNSKRIIQQNPNDQVTSTTKDTLTSAESNTNQGSFPGDLRQIEPANNLARHASIASLSLISVNSVDSGTSCHEGSLTDSSTSSDKEMEIQGKLHASLRKPVSTFCSTNQRLEEEAKQYTASARELERLILASCFGRDKHGAGLVTSDYESDTGPDGVRNDTEDGRRRKGGVSRVVRFVEGKNDMDVAKETRRKEQQLKPKGQISTRKSATNIKHQFPAHPTNNHLTKLTTRARVLHSHKALSKAEMSVQRGDVIFLAPEDFEQRPLWVVAYSSSSGEMGLMPSVYLATNEIVRGPSLG